MGRIVEFELEKLVVGIMYVNQQVYVQALTALSDAFGKVDNVMDEYSFSRYSTFYDSEMGGHVLKRFVSFERLVNPSLLPKIKCWTNELESRLSNESGRCVNIDPCILGHGRFVMATTKGASFRVPLQDGIFADISLVYSRNEWHHFFWTYHDVKSDFFKRFLIGVRTLYLHQRTRAANGDVK